jgi:hypothetical protein
LVDRPQDAPDEDGRGTHGRGHAARDPERSDLVLDARLTARRAAVARVGELHVAPDRERAAGHERGGARDTERDRHGRRAGLGRRRGRASGGKHHDELPPLAAGELDGLLDRPAIELEA